MTNPGASAEKRKASPPFSPVVVYGDLVFVSGTIGRNPETGEIARGDVAAQTRQTLETIRRRLEQVGSSMDQVVKATVFLVDMAHFPEMNEAYRAAFPEGRLPARSCVQVVALPDPEALVEIEVIAGRKK
jgi:2-iminobutanoate/2-iminopropanoate deaminase